MVTATCLLTPSRRRSRLPVVPREARDGTLQAAHILMGFPAKVVTISPSLRPAFAAGRPRSLWRSRRRPHWSIQVLGNFGA